MTPRPSKSTNLRIQPELYERAQRLADRATNSAAARKRLRADLYGGEVKTLEILRLAVEAGLPELERRARGK